MSENAYRITVIILLVLILFGVFANTAMQFRQSTFGLRNSHYPMKPGLFQHHYQKGPSFFKKDYDGKKDLKENKEDKESGMLPAMQVIAG